MAKYYLGNRRDLKYFSYCHELKPVYQKSFWGRAWVYSCPNGDEVLRSYDTLVMSRKPDGTLVRHWGGWSATTGKHIYAFCGLHKAEYEKLPFGPQEGV